MGNLIVPDQYATIDDAVNAAVDGDNIGLRPGTYTGEYIIPKAVNLVAIVDDPTLKEVVFDPSARHLGQIKYDIKRPRL